MILSENGTHFSGSCFESPDVDGRNKSGHDAVTELDLASWRRQRQDGEYNEILPRILRGRPTVPQ